MNKTYQRCDFVNFIFLAVSYNAKRKLLDSYKVIIIFAVKQDN